MEYGLWLKGVHGPGHASGTFDGPFDMVMDFFYIPHLLVAEYLIRRTRPHSRKVANWGGGIALLLLVAATCLFALAYWLPHVRDQLARLAAM
jgi:hypothetical protein